MNEQTILAAGPLLALGGLLAVLGAIDLRGRERTDVVGGSKLAWAFALALVPVGPIVYLWLGRKTHRPR